MHRARLQIDLGASTPHHDQTVAAVLRAEVFDVLHERLCELHLVGCLLDVLAVELANVVAIEHRLHRLDRFEIFANLIQKRRLEHTGVACGRVAVFREHVPATAHDVVDVGERHEVRDARCPFVGAFPESDRAHLRQRTDRLGEAAPRGGHTGDERSGDGAESREQDSELPRAGSDLRRRGHGSSVVWAPWSARVDDALREGAGNKRRSRNLERPHKYVQLIYFIVSIIFYYHYPECALEAAWIWLCSKPFEPSYAPAACAVRRRHCMYPSRR